ncbi:RTA1 like protein-domain-containing protein [Fusarium redolens]|uniref:RTA1 like protein-domain-containing protein n=1 Tax=Fusarium redolens TaxID=48865 RepID=A0A9P9GSN6_FUSRE|nr:RTA1 like protein-domain-containing protein [Fusarium redolens]KAH7244561.1 RTA1 like protein-domain-containing protein [Fusarium redolens]
MSADQDLRKGCHSLVTGIHTSYGYAPTTSAGIVFCILFRLSTISHIIQLGRSKVWWCIVFVVGGLVEIIGWAGRTWSSQCPYNSTAFLMQISTLIIAPVFFTAGVYIILGRLIQVFGRNCSILRPSLYLWIFCTCDVISLVVQAVGGGLASSEVNKINGNTDPGTNIMVAGIVFQLASMSVFVALAIDFLIRSTRQGILKSRKQSSIPILSSMTLSLLCIYLRSIYRTIELSQGWTGYLITHERYFITLDGAMMVIAVGVFNFIHPATFLPRSPAEDNGEWLDITRRPGSRK